eukprot:XP_001701749.1 predicted protein [Chlamydomonas reinhardtii]
MGSCLSSPEQGKHQLVSKASAVPEPGGEVTVKAMAAVLRQKLVCTKQRLLSREVLPRTRPHFLQRCRTLQWKGLPPQALSNRTVPRHRHQRTPQILTQQAQPLPSRAWRPHPAARDQTCRGSAAQAPYGVAAAPPAVAVQTRAQVTE